MKPGVEQPIPLSERQSNELLQPLNYSGYSEMGIGQARNEDGLWIDSVNHMFIVWDGVGGKGGGDSAGAVGVSISTIGEEKGWVEKPLENMGDQDLKLSASRKLGRLIRVMNSVILQESRQGRTAVGMAYLWHDPTRMIDVASIARVGDVRALLVRQGVASFVTTDDLKIYRERGLSRYEIAEIEERIGRMPPDKLTGVDYDVFNARNVISGALGTENLALSEHLGMWHIELDPGDIILLCSDGYTDVSSLYDIEEEAANFDAYDLVNRARTRAIDVNNMRRKGYVDDTTLIKVMYGVYRG